MWGGPSVPTVLLLQGRASAVSDCSPATDCNPQGAAASAASRDALGGRAWPVTAIRVWTLVLSTLFLVAVSLLPVKEPKLMFLDTLAAAEFAETCCRPYYGFVSTVGIMLWVATAAVCLFCAVVFALAHRARAVVIFAATAGLLSGWLALDDAFLVHEIVLPELGIAQNLVLAAIVVSAVAYVVANHRIILNHDKWLLLLACGALAFSMGVDTLFQSLDPVLVYVEDGAKFFGIFFWASFHVTTMARMLLQPCAADDLGFAASFR